MINQLQGIQKIKGNSYETVCKNTIISDHWIYLFSQYSAPGRFEQLILEIMYSTSCTSESNWKLATDVILNPPNMVFLYNCTLQLNYNNSTYLWRYQHSSMDAILLSQVFVFLIMVFRHGNYFIPICCRNIVQSQLVMIETWVWNSFQAERDHLKTINTS